MVHDENHAKQKWPILTVRRFWVKEPRRSETVSEKKSATFIVACVVSMGQSAKNVLVQTIILIDSFTPRELKRS